MDSQVVAIIPARYGSTRLPGKALSLIDGRPMVQHVYERTVKIRSVSRTIVATDDDRIAAVVHGFDGEVAMTRSSHSTGTDRVAEVARSLSEEIVVNVQGDLPFLQSSMLEEAVAMIREDSSLPMATLKTPIYDEQELLRPQVVKVVSNRQGDALYFTRSPVPYRRQGSTSVLAYRHIGLYVFQREFLIRFSELEPTPLEQAEQLEQLRALEHGFRVRVTEVADDLGVEVDTPDDLERARALAR